MSDHGLRRAVMSARDAGETAATATRQIAVGNAETDHGGSTWRSRWGPPVTSAQVGSAAKALRRFAAELSTVNDVLEVQGACRIDELSGAVDDLSISTTAAAEVHNRVNRSLAELERIRVALILDRPLPGQAPTSDDG